MKLPVDLDYCSIGSLSREVAEKLETTRPTTLGQAGRIPGMTPAAVIALLHHVKSASKDKAA